MVAEAVVQPAAVVVETKWDNLCTTPENQPKQESPIYRFTMAKPLLSFNEHSSGVITTLCGALKEVDPKNIRDLSPISELIHNCYFKKVG